MLSIHWFCFEWWIWILTGFPIGARHSWLYQTSLENSNCFPISATTPLCFVAVKRCLPFLIPLVCWISSSCLHLSFDLFLCILCWLDSIVLGNLDSTCCERWIFCRLREIEVFSVYIDNRTSWIYIGSPICERTGRVACSPCGGSGWYTDLYFFGFPNDLFCGLLLCENHSLWAERIVLDFLSLVKQWYCIAEYLLILMEC